MKFIQICFWFVAVFFWMHLALAKEKADVREINVPTQQMVENQQGLLSSYNLGVLSKNVRIVWNFSFSEDVVFQLKAKTFSYHYQAENVCPRCCPENALIVPDDYLYDHIYCGRHVFEKSVAVGKHFFVEFRSTLNHQGIELEYSARKKTQPCSGNSFNCFDKKGCYSVDKICDGEYDCEDHSDEVNCRQCRPNFTMCSYEDHKVTEHRTCFNPQLQRCDGILHCQTGEDEFNCVAECENKIRCDDGKGCYDMKERCDARFNCEDHSDERNCMGIRCDVLANTHGYFRCSNGWCIKSFKMYDGFFDCDDGSDENFTPQELNDNFGLMMCVYVLILLSLIWIVVLQCFGIYRCISDSTNTAADDVESVGSDSSFIYNYTTKALKRNAASQFPSRSCSSVCPSALSPDEIIVSEDAESLSYDSIHSSQESLGSVASISKEDEEIQPPPSKTTRMDHQMNLCNSIKNNNNSVVNPNVHNQIPHPRNYELWI